MPDDCGRPWGQAGHERVNRPRLPRRHAVGGPVCCRRHGLRPARPRVDHQRSPDRGVAGDGCRGAAEGRGPALHGTLDWRPTAGNVFQLVDTVQLFENVGATTVSAGFTTFVLPNPGPGLEWDVSALYTDGSISVAMLGCDFPSRLSAATFGLGVSTFLRTVRGRPWNEGSVGCGVRSAQALTAAEQSRRSSAASETRAQTWSTDP